MGGPPSATARLLSTNGRRWSVCTHNPHRALRPSRVLRGLPPLVLVQENGTKLGEPVGWVFGPLDCAVCADLRAA